MRRFFLTGIVLVITFMADAVMGQELETRIFQLNNRPADATLEIVRPMLSPAGTVIAETRLQKLIVRDIAERLAEVERLLVEIDQAAPQVRIHVSMSGVSPSQGRSLAIGLYGDLRHPSIGLDAQGNSGTSWANSQQNLLVMSGERGLITMARDLVTVEPYLDYALNRGLLAPTLVVQSVSTGFAVEPVVVGDVVRMTVTPWFGFVGPEGGSEVMVQEASTTVSLQSGQEMTIASGSSRQEVQGTAFGLVFGSAGTSLERGATVTVRPEIFDGPSSHREAP